MSFTCIDSFGALRVSRKSYIESGHPVTTFDKRKMLPVSEYSHDEFGWYCLAVWADSPESSPPMWAYC